MAPTRASPTAKGTSSDSPTARAGSKQPTGTGGMPTLHLMVGLPCSGKTTLARKLESERSALRLTPDEWQVVLFGQDADEPEHDARHTSIESLLWSIASRALEL